MDPIKLAAGGVEIIAGCKLNGRKRKRRETGRFKVIWFRNTFQSFQTFRLSIFVLRSSRITSIPIKSNNYWREGRKGLFKFRKIKNLNSHRTISYLTEDHRPRAVWLQGSAREGKIREWTRKRWFGGLEPTGDERRKSVSWGILGLGFPRLAISTGHEGGTVGRVRVAR